MSRVAYRWSMDRRPGKVSPAPFSAYFTWKLSEREHHGGEDYVDAGQILPSRRSTPGN